MSNLIVFKKLFFLFAIFIGLASLIVQYYPYLSSYQQHSRNTNDLAATQNRLAELSQHTPQNPQLIIPALHLDIPIIQNVDGTRGKIYDLALQDGVAQLNNSAHLDSQIGNTVIFGHSSFFSISHTTFNAIFATIPQLVPGDTLSIWDTHHITNYEISESKQISASAVQVADPTPNRQITLLTCWPLGLALKRWVVVAHPIP